MKLYYSERKFENTPIRLPASKSISNRALIIQQLTSNPITLFNLSEAEDTLIMQAQLNSKSTKKDVGIAGTVARFLTAALSVEQSTYLIKGHERMHQRPMGVLLDALEKLGVEIKYLEQKGFLPIQINGSKIKGGTLNLNANISSQFISALMMIAPKIDEGLTLNLEGEISSKPYLEMTKSLMEYFGVQVNFNQTKITIEQQNCLLKQIGVRLLIYIVL